MASHVNECLLNLLRVIDSPLLSSNVRSYRVLRSSYDSRLYSIAETNKIPLAYLNTISPEEREKIPRYNYHRARLRRLLEVTALEVTAEISALLERREINYAIFKTLRPFPEDVPDTDILNMGSYADYKKTIEVLKRKNYILKSKGNFSITFQDYKTRFKSEIMIDIYNEISVGNVIYLNKRELTNFVVKKSLHNE